MSLNPQHGVRIQRNVLIPMSDGVALAGDLFLPDAPGRFPALVSYYPYHKDDVIGALLDHPNRYFAERGYASLLVDFRGLGSSEGVVADYRGPREGTDSAAIVEWAAAQPWCDGNVGMWGMSYGGLTALKAAAERPPHLKAIVPMNASADPYTDNVYPGGCFTYLGQFGTWGPWMLAMSLLPPMYQDTAGRWYQLWMERLGALGPPYVFPLQEHPWYDAYWEDKAIAVERVDVPAYLMTAWRDQNPGAMTAAYERVRGPRKLLVGPWMHWMPDLAAFHRVDYLREMARWWDRWLKDEPTGIDTEPPVTIFVQGVGWRHEAAWPIVRAETRGLFFDADGALAPGRPSGEGSRTYCADPTVGVSAGLWDPAGTGMGLPRDQGPDDMRSITFTTLPLAADMELTGSPEGTLSVALDEGEDANLVVKLCDLDPDGGSALITTGWRKASHRLSHERPAPLTAGTFYEFRVQLVPTSYLVRAGHRLRVAVSCSDFPRIWPTRTNPVIRLAFGGESGSCIAVPVVSPSGVPGPELPVPDPTVNRTPLDVEGAPRYRVEHDFASNTVCITTGLRAVLLTPARDGRFQMDRTARAWVSAARPDAARVEGEAVLTAVTPSGSTIVASGRSWVSLTGQMYSGRVTLDGELVFEKQWRGLAAPGMPA